VEQSGPLPISATLPLRRHGEQLRRAQQRIAADGQWVAPPSAALPGYQSLFVDQVLQADQGCDMDFLVGRRGAVARVS